MADRGERKTRVGRVVSNATAKTVTIEVETTRSHPLYSKTVRRQRKLYAHDESDACSVGDLVRVAETRPLSKRKRWRVVDIIEKART